MYSPSCRVTTRKELIGFRNSPFDELPYSSAAERLYYRHRCHPKVPAAFVSSSKRRSKNCQTTSTTSKFGCFTATKRHHLLAGTIMYQTVYDLTWRKNKISVDKDPQKVSDVTYIILEIHLRMLCGLKK